MSGLKQYAIATKSGCNLNNFHAKSHKTTVPTIKKIKFRMYGEMFPSKIKRRTAASINGYAGRRKVQGISFGIWGRSLCQPNSPNCPNFIRFVERFQ